MKNLSYLTRVFLLTIILSIAGPLSAASAQSGSVDPGFSTIPSGPLTDETTFKHIVQPDGKVIGFNAPLLVVNGVVRGTVFRLNADGSVDNTFSYCECGSISPESAMLTPDGKIVLAGSNGSTAKMIRLNSDGSIDPGFTVLSPTNNPPELSFAAFSVSAIQPDGRVLALRSSWLWQSSTGQIWTHILYRINADGTNDATFNPITLPSNFLVSVQVLIDLLPDGRFYMAVTSGNSLMMNISLRRWLANGTADPVWTEFSRSAPAGGVVAFKDIQAVDDGVLVSGKLSQSAGVRGFIKVGAAGIDTSFASPTVYEGFHFKKLPSGGYIYSMRSQFAFDPIRMVRLTPAGAIDNTYSMDPTIATIVNDWDSGTNVLPVFLAKIGSGRRLVRLLENGAIDPNFNAPLSLASCITLTAVQTDGKVLVAGPFTAINGVSRNRMARLNADGSLDTTFDPAAGFDVLPGRIVIQPDGKILVAGNFSRFNGENFRSIVRLNPDGSRDTSFSVDPNNSVQTVALQSDGRVLIGGQFTSVNGTGRTNIARLSSTGVLDATFNPVIDKGDFLEAINIEPSGKIMIGGRFDGIGGMARQNMARLEANGNLDPAFNAGVIPSIGSIWQQASGKYIIRNGQNLWRLNLDGSLDESFDAPAFTKDGLQGSVSDLLFLPNGDMIAGGTFDAADSTTRNNIVRLRPDGGLDLNFMLTGTNGTVTGLTMYPGGRVLVAGPFTHIQSQFRLGLARVNVSSRRVPFDFDGDGRSDISVLRPSTNRWYEVLSSTGQVYEEAFGVAGDILAPADFDGDGITDEAIFRPSNGQWWYRSSVNGGYIANAFGESGDVPRPSDFDGDGKADLILFRPSNSTWYRVGSLNPTQQAPPVVFGVTGDQPLVGDFDGDGKSDLAVFRPSTGDWWYSASSASGAFVQTHWGQNGDIPVPADYDGDGKTDHAVFRPSDGGWYVYNSSNQSFTTTAFGTAGDRPVAADYDGDGRADLAVFRPSTGIWYLLRTTSGFAGYQFGISTDVAIPGSLLP